MAGNEADDEIDKNRNRWLARGIFNPADKGARAGRRLYKACLDASRSPSGAFSGMG